MSERNRHIFYQAAFAAGRSKGNIEDQIRTINELIKGFEILTVLNTPLPANPPSPYVAYRDLKAELDILKGELSRCLGEFSKSVSNGEYLIKTADPMRKEETFNYLVSFLMSFASRTATRDRLHIFTTNYDRIIEVGAELAGLRLIDRFVGSIAPVFRSSRLEVDYHYNPPGIRGEPRYLEGVARFTKLHGSLDWHEQNNAIRRFGLPFGARSVEPFLEAEGHQSNSYEKLMIYPNSVKDRETAEYPYVELFRDLAAATSRPNSTLVTYGYSFGDEHINRVIEDMLTVPSTHIVIIAFGDPLQRIMSFISKSGRKAQITLLMGDHLGDLKILVDNYLPKPAIDKASIKMAELLKQRGFIQSKELGSSTGTEA
ncbi:SIR2 family protein [Edwardsiella anguillarum]|nr:SIR2 family protein [Edwardsiella anguillarum]